MGEFTVDVIEQRDDLLFIGGTALTAFVGDTVFNTVLQYSGGKKSGRKVADVALKVTTLIVEGEPVEAVAAQQAVLVALLGDATPLIDVAAALAWKRKSKRILRTTDDALTLNTTKK